MVATIVAVNAVAAQMDQISHSWSWGEEFGSFVSTITSELSLVVFKAVLLVLRLVLVVGIESLFPSIG